MNNSFDVMVIGLGAHGSSALYHLSKSGYKVAGIDRFMPPHIYGSSHGESRIIRQAYHESPAYVSLVKEAYKLWAELEKLSRKQLFLQTGGIMLGSEDSAVVTGARLSAETHGIAYEYLQGKELRKRFPALLVTDNTTGVVEKKAGILFPEKCIAAHLQLAAANAAVLLYNEKVMSIEANDKKVTIITDKNRYETRKLVVSAGAWFNHLFPELNLPLTIERQVQYWYKNTNASLQPYFLPNALPVYIWEYESGKMFYGFPDLGNGIKAALHHAGKSVLPDELSQAVNEEEKAGMKDIVGNHLAADLQFHSSAVCIYTNTPDEHFIIDYHPQYSNIIIASPCSGHGFKFSALTGKIVADMAMEKEIGFDIKPFRIGRFFGQ